MSSNHGLVHTVFCPMSRQFKWIQDLKIPNVWVDGFDEIEYE